MKPDDGSFAPRRSAIGFVLAVTAAAATLAVAGLIVELRWYAAADSALAQVQSARIAQPPCPPGAEEPVRCALPPDHH